MEQVQGAEGKESILITLRSEPLMHGHPVSVSVTLKDHDLRRVVSPKEHATTAGNAKLAWSGSEQYDFCRSLRKFGVANKQGDCSTT